MMLRTSCSLFSLVSRTSNVCPFLWVSSCMCMIKPVDLIVAQRICFYHRGGRHLSVIEVMIAMKVSFEVHFHHCITLANLLPLIPYLIYECYFQWCHIYVHVHLVLVWLQSIVQQHLVVALSLLFVGSGLRYHLLRLIFFFPISEGAFFVPPLCVCHLLRSLILSITQILSAS